MFNTFLSIFLLLTPGIIATEILMWLKKSKKNINLEFFVNALIFSFAILGSNALVVFVWLGDYDVFKFISSEFQILTLISYIGLSLIFSFIFPNILLMVSKLYQHWTSNQ